jgi:hypothetical protein
MITAMIRRYGLLFSCALAALALPACASMSVRSYLERRVDFAQYRTYDWAADDRLVTGDPRLDNNPFFLDRLHADVERQLASRGFEKTTLPAPDLRVHYHASVTERLNIETEPVTAFCAGCLPYVYQAGTLVLDLVDTRTGQLVWRGWAEGSIEGVIDDQAAMEKAIDDAVARIVERVPRRPS